VAAIGMRSKSAGTSGGAGGARRQPGSQQRLTEGYGSASGMRSWASRLLGYSGRRNNRPTSWAWNDPNPAQRQPMPGAHCSGEESRSRCHDPGQWARRGLPHPSGGGPGTHPGWARWKLLV